MADLAAWLERIGLGQYADAFAEAAIDLDVLSDLSEADLADLGLKLGDRKRLLKAVAARDPGDDSNEVEATPRSRGSAAERRQLTVMFVDLVGSTELSRRLDPEDLGEVMRAYHGRAAEEIRRWGGHVAKYLGDGVLAYFGWPEAHEDDAERAVRAGLGLTDAIGELDDGTGKKLAVRVGIATGPVVVGELIGEGPAQEQAVVGETPNLAARLQTAATPGAVVIGAATRQLLGELFELERLDGLDLKGFEGGTVAFRITGEGRSESRFEATRGHRLTPLVGREHELGLLLDRWARAKEGEGQVVLLSGEAGIGKSRLIEALRERLRDEPHTPLPHYGSAHHTNSAFYPIIRHLERAAGFARDDPPAARLDKLETLLRPSSDDLAAVMPLIAPLLGLDIGQRYPALDLTPQRRKQLTLEALVEQVEGLARERPVLAIYEDVHWFDPSSMDAISHLIGRVADSRVMVLIAFRPGFSPPWQGYGHVTSLSLSRLSRRDGAGMITLVTGGRSLPPEIEAELLARTDGIPLFVEELTKAVLESGLLHETVDGYTLSGPLPPLAIPSSLHDSLMARLDRLAPVKDVAQIASVIGREFPHALLAAVAGRSAEELDAALDRLEAADLIWRRGVGPDATFTFKHALVQDAAYQSLLRSRREQLHARLAQAIERLPDRPADVLAQHLAASGDACKAASYFVEAARQSVEKSALREAAAYLTEGLRQLETTARDAARDRLELDLKATLGSVQIALLGPTSPETLATYERVRQLAASCGDPEIGSFALHGIWQSYTTRGKHIAATDTAGDMLRHAEECRDPGIEFIGRRMIGASLLFRGRLDPAAQELERALALTSSNFGSQHSVNYSLDGLAACKAMFAVLSWLCGHIDRSAILAQAALERANDVGHTHTLALTIHYASNVLLVLRREFHEARKTTQELLQLSNEQGFPHWIALSTILNGVAMELGTDEEGGLSRIDEGMQSADRIGWQQFRPFYLCMASTADMKRHHLEAAAQRLEQALECVRRTDERWAEPEIWRCRGDVALLRPETGGEPESLYQRAVALAREQRAKAWELRATTSLARLWAEQGERQKAHDLLAPVYGWFTEGFDTKDLKDAKALLDQLA